MKRSKTVVLGLLVLFGAAATGFLVVLLVADGPERTRGAGGAAAGREQERDRRGGPPQLGPNAQVVQETAGRGTIPSGSTGASRTREPFDGPEAMRARAQKSGRVLELLDRIMVGASPTERIQLAAELKRLIRELGHHVDPAVRDRLLEMLVTVPAEWRMQIGEAIGQLQGDRETANRLVDLLKEQMGESPDQRTHYAIHHALANMDVPDVAPKLLAMMGQGYAWEAMLVETVGRVGGPEEVDALFGMLRDGPLRDKTRRAIEAVLQQKRAQPGLLDRIAGVLDRDEGLTDETRASLVKVLAHAEDPRHAEMLRRLARDETNSEVRRHAILGLGRLGDPQSGAVLLEIIQAGPEHERLRATQAIQTIKDPETIGVLAEKYGTLDTKGRLAVMGAASRLALPGDDLMELARDRGIHDPEMRVRTAAARLLGRRGRDENVAPLGQLIARAKHPGEWQTALRALENIGTARAADEALRSLNTIPNDRQRRSWAERFEKLRDQAVRREDPAGARR